MKKALRVLIALLGVSLGIGAAALAVNVITRMGGYVLFGGDPWMYALLLCGAGLVGGIIFYLYSTRLLRWIEMVERKLQGMPPGDILAATLGLLLGLLVAFLLSWLARMIPWAGVDLLISILLYCILGMIGCRVAYKKREELRNFRFAAWREMVSDAREKRRNPSRGTAKILDTSVIIDGRIYDVLQTGFLEGPLVVSRAVLTELRHIADSADELRRARGRRGLEILARIQREIDIEVEITDEDNPEIEEVDAKLLWLAQRRGGKVVTTDYNLNKVARVQQVPVLNVNDLANAIKPVVIAGEPLEVRIVKEGKEPGQGVAYLDDGTMVVVENGTRLLGQETTVIVTSALQTSAGRMIFAKPKAER